MSDTETMSETPPPHPPGQWAVDSTDNSIAIYRYAFTFISVDAIAGGGYRLITNVDGRVEIFDLDAAAAARLAGLLTGGAR